MPNAAVIPFRWTSLNPVHRWDAKYWIFVAAKVKELGSSPAKASDELVRKAIDLVEQDIRLAKEQVKSKMAQAHQLQQEAHKLQQEVDCLPTMTRIGKRS